MTDYYCDFTTGSDANTGLSWAQAFKTWEWLEALVSLNSHRGFVRAGASPDTSASSRTIGSPQSKIYGVKSGTTAEPPTSSDFAVRGTDTLPVVQVTGTALITFDFSLGIHGVHFKMNAGSVLGLPTSRAPLNFYGCIIDAGSGFIRITGGQSTLWRLHDCELKGAYLSQFSDGRFEMVGGSIVTTNASQVLVLDNDASETHFIGVDLSGVTSNNVITSGSIGPNVIKFINCKMKSGWAATTANSSAPAFECQFIGCSSSTAAKGSTTSLQDFAMESEFGTVDLETTAVRTGGADDGASGLFSRAMTPFAGKTFPAAEGLVGPWQMVWVPGGASKTLTVYIANSGASDYNTDDVFCEMLLVSSTDDPQPDYHALEGGLGSALDTATAIADDTGSTWGTGASNHQKFSVTSTPGFEGWCYARVHFKKDFASSPETLYVDPRIEVT